MGWVNGNWDPLAKGERSDNYALDSTVHVKTGALGELFDS